jgi:hypothetical protein
LTTVYASADAARIAASPAAVSTPHTRQPAAARAAASRPEPSATLVTTATSGPGTTVSSASTRTAASSELHTTLIIEPAAADATSLPRR